MQLTYNQKKQLWHDGWTKVPGVIPSCMVEAALRAINYSVGEGLDPEKMTAFSHVSFCPELQKSPVILDLLFATPAWALVKSALGEEIDKPRLGQIALRFPTLEDPPSPPQPHLDGTYGEQPGHVSSFTMLVGILLNDVSRENAGNFTVWPGSHHHVEQYARDHGPRILTQGRPPIDLPQPVQVTGQAGDIIMAHYLLPHTAATNVSPYVRYGIFFRVHYPQEPRKWDSLVNMWQDWPGLADVVTAG